MTFYFLAPSARGSNTVDITLFRTVPCRAVQYRTVPYRTVPYRTVPYHTIPYHTIPYHTIPYHTIPYTYFVMFKFYVHLPASITQNDRPHVRSSLGVRLTGSLGLRDLGNRSNGSEQTIARTPNARNPSHQAPIQRGSRGWISTSIRSDILSTL